MRTNFKTKLAAMLSVLALSFIAAGALQAEDFSQPKTANAQETAPTTVFSATQLGIKDVTPTAYSASGTFAMELGASVRVDSVSPGIRYQVNLSDTYAGLADTYSADSYTYDYYVKIGVPVNGDYRYRYVAGTPEGNATDGYTYTASLTFDGLTTTEFADYKQLDIEGQGVLVLTANEGEAKTVITATLNDNTRTMEGVVNAAKLAGSLDSYGEATQTEMAKFIPGENYISEEKVYAEKATGVTLAEIEAGFAADTVKTVYLGAKKFDSEDNIDLSEVEAGTVSESYITVVDTDGKFTNRKYMCADKVIRKQSELNYFEYGSSIPAHYSGGTLDTYVVVANDLKFGDESNGGTGKYAAYTVGLQGSYSSKGFTGTFDGQGHTVEYQVYDGGLFGSLLKGAVVKNASFVVVGCYKDTTNNTWKDARNVILARFATEITLENVYAKYAESCVTGATGSSYTFASIGSWSSSFGLFAYSVAGTFTNVIVDTTAVDSLVKTAYESKNLVSGSTTMSYGALFAAANGRETPTLTNTYVYSSLKELMICAYESNSYIYVTEDEQTAYQDAMQNGEGYENTQYGSFTLYSKEGVKRYDSAANSQSFFAENATLLAAFSWLNTSAGYPTL